MKSLRVVLSGIYAAVFIALARASTTKAQLQGGVDAGAQAARGNGQPSEIFADGAIFGDIVNTMLFLIGAIAVVMIVYAGFRYVISGGNASNVTAAKNTILYAIVGLIVASLSYAVINFVLVNLESSVSGGTSGL